MGTKNLFVVCATFLLACALYSCDNDKEPDFTNKGKDKYVKFSGSIEGALTKASGTSWGNGDAIGVYMKATGSTLSAGSLEDNVKYTTPGDGLFSPAVAGAGIEFPASGAVDFIAYYPHKTPITGYSMPFSVADQRSLPAIDILYSDNATNVGNTNPTVPMNFRHKLSQLILNISAGDGITSLNGLTLSIANMKVEGTLNLEGGTVAAGGNATTLTVPPSITGTTATVNAILIPGQNLKDTPLTFILNGKTYEWTPTDQMLLTGKKYTYPVQLSLTGVVILNPNATIEDWVEGNTGGGGVVITPKEDAEFKVNKTTVTLNAAAGSNEVIQLTAPSTQTWTAAATDSWLTLSSTDGTGGGNITLTATENTATTSRSTTVKIKPTGTTTFAEITITVTQEGSGTTGPTLLFPGSDFENWTAFLGSLHPSYGLISSGYAVQSATGGRNGSSALHLNGTPSNNDYVFTALAGSGALASGSRIVFYIKGTSAKSLSLNVYSGDGVANGYYKFNLEDCTGDKTIIGLSANNSNSYIGTINTGGQWAKITLDISDIELNTGATDSYFALKTGKDAAYDLYVDDITIE